MFCRQGADNEYSTERVTKVVGGFNNVGYDKLRLVHQRAMYDKPARVDTLAVDLFADVGCYDDITLMQFRNTLAGNGTGVEPIVKKTGREIAINTLQCLALAILGLKVRICSHKDRKEMSLAH